MRTKLLKFPIGEHPYVNMSKCAVFAKNPVGSLRSVKKKQLLCFFLTNRNLLSHDSLSSRIFGNPHDCDLDEIVKEMAFYNEDNFFTLRMCGPGATEPDKLCIHSNLGSISLQVLNFTIPAVSKKIIRVI